MAKIKNTGRQTRGFFTDDGGHVTVQPGEEKEFNMTEADYNKITELAATEDPPLFEISGGHGGVKKLSAKEQAEADAKKRESETKREPAKKKD
jgi:hypothetical protein